MGRKSRQTSLDTDWATPGGRVRWLLLNVWKGNRLAMAQDVGLSHAAINKVAACKQEPGRRLLEAISSHPKINPAWLLSGQGTPLLQPADDQLKARPVPIASQPLPGSPQQYAALLSEAALDPGHLFLSSQYWLSLQKGQPILDDPDMGFLLGDCLLMETQHKRFPPEERLDNHLCLVRQGDPEPTLKLATVSYFQPTAEEPPRLEADTFDLGVPKGRLVKECVFRKYPGGKLEAYERELHLVSFRGRERIAEVSDSDVLPSLIISYADIVAVWLKVLYRP